MGECQCHLYAGVVHADRPAIVNSDPENVPGQKGILSCGLTDKDTSDQYAGCI